VVSIHRILVPVDFSVCASHALTHAIALARWYKAELLGLHVTEGAFDAGCAAPDPLAEVDRFLSPAREAGLAVSSSVLEGTPARAIVDHALAMPVDLVVMGSHGRRGFERLLIGSVTERVVRMASCPVLTVPRAAPDPSGGRPPFRSILCPIDFSGHSLRAMEHAMSLARESDARLTLIHSLEWLPDWNDHGTPQAMPPELPSWLETRARERLEALLDQETLAFARPEVLVVRGKAYQEILRAAAEREAEVIVMGLQGRHPLDLAVFGSTTNHVVRAAECPVMTLKAD
jgi:nucleotide-binding universal stress UspA family protein